MILKVGHHQGDGLCFRQRLGQSLHGRPIGHGQSGALAADYTLIDPHGTPELQLTPPESPFDQRCQFR